MKVLIELDKTIQNFNPWTNVYGLARSIIASATLLTLIFNSTEVLMMNTDNCNILTIPTVFCFTNSIISPEVIRFIFIIIMLLVVVGWRPRITGILHYFIVYSIHGNAIVIDGGEHIASLIVFWLIPITLCDPRKSHWSLLDNHSKINVYQKFISWLFFKIIKVQVAIIYANAAIARLKNPEWIDGTALYYFLTDILLGHSPYLSWLIVPIIESELVVLMTWGTTIVELVLFAGLFASNKIKKYILALGLLLHLGIAVTIGIVTFSIVMIGTLLLYLLTMDEHLPLQKNRILKGVVFKSDYNDTVKQAQ